MAESQQPPRRPGSQPESPAENPAQAGPAAQQPQAQQGPVAGSPMNGNGPPSARDIGRMALSAGHRGPLGLPSGGMWQPPGTPHVPPDGI